MSDPDNNPPEGPQEMRHILADDFDPVEITNQRGPRAPYKLDESKWIPDDRGLVLPLPQFSKVRQRQGRAPTLYRQEVEQIRRDNRPVADIARYYRVSEMTIRRVKRVGQFADFDYIPADEYDRTITSTGNPVQPTMSPSQAGRSGGRKLKRGKELTPYEVQNIVSLKWPLRDIAAQYNVSVTTVKRLRDQWQGWVPAGKSLEQMIREDPRADDLVAVQYGITPATVRHVKEGYNIIAGPGAKYPPNPGEPAHVFEKDTTLKQKRTHEPHHNTTTPADELTTGGNDDGMAVSPASEMDVYPDSGDEVQDG